MVTADRQELMHLTMSGDQQILSLHGSLHDTPISVLVPGHKDSIGSRFATQKK